MKGFSPFSDIGRAKYICLWLTALLFCGVITTKAQDENFESSDPVLISEADSVKALAVKPESWRGGLPAPNSEYFPPGSRAVVFVTKVALAADEGANAFRAFAEDARGKKFRLTVENVQQLKKQDWIYALTLQIADANGYN